jgi:hypothetical protein
MTYDIIFIALIVAFLTVKLKDISLRHQLNESKERRLLLSGGLVILFLMASLLIPFPQSLYWFIVLGIVFTVVLVAFDIIKLEWQRLLRLKPKDRVINILFYSLLAVVVNLFI